ncbi:hypothetical protein B0O80DRAFT_454927 [Mortierella sp. GBAus27b]|nr:hypothetical protein BGX31_003273 [Mortierella sp. GBA43]KAI8351875.1 hypothetical protein B0O80DRAFT_454927 [Mortierella sp. GBAus27b]
MLLVKALLLVCSATAVFAGSRIDAIVSGACFVGQDTSQDTRGEEVFRDPRNHATAVASILRHSADRAEFRPREKGVITDPKVYEQFLKDVNNFPGFKSHHQQMERLDLQGDREQFKREVAKKYQTDRNDPWQIATAFERLLPHEVDEDNQEWLLNYVVMNTQGSQRGGGGQKDISVEICSITLKLTKDSNDQTKIKRQTAEMKMNMFTVKQEYLAQHANSLAQRIRTMDARKALRELSSNGLLGDDDNNGGDLEAWFEGLFIPDYLPRSYPVSRWQF